MRRRQSSSEQLREFRPAQNSPPGAPVSITEEHPFHTSNRPWRTSSAGENQPANREPDLPVEQVNACSAVGSGPWQKSARESAHSHANCITCRDDSYYLLP